MVTDLLALKTQEIVVGLGELFVTCGTSTVISCIGLGSCVALCMFDSVTRIGGMAHIVLPRFDGITTETPAKYANTAVPSLLAEILKCGGNKSNLIVKIAGGAQLTLAPGINNTFKTGERNVQEVMLALQKAGLPLSAADIGGAKGRTMRLYMDTGKVTVRSIGGPDREL